MSLNFIEMLSVMRKIPKIIKVLVFIVGAMGIVGLLSYQLALNTPVVSETQILAIEKGDTLTSLLRKLQQRNIKINPFWFKWIATQQQLHKYLKIGEYQLKAGMTTAQIFAVLFDNKTRQYSITFPEGWTFKQMLQKLAGQPDLQHTLGNMDNETLMAKLNAEYQYPEGLFFPDTYFFSKGATDFSVLKKAHQKMQTVLQNEWQNKENDLPLATSYQALILASIIEKETAAEEERPLIAGVFVQRLKIGMLLQTDPTVIYGMGDKYQGNIRREDLHTATAYNTYVIKGLPPTPIAMPGQAAIHAALHPEKTKNLYFVAKGNGQHFFSATLEAHHAAVNTYQRHKK